MAWFLPIKPEDDPHCDVATYVTPEKSAYWCIDGDPINVPPRMMVECPHCDFWHQRSGVFKNPRAFV